MQGGREGSVYDLNIPDDELWLFLGDFNFIRGQENRNKLGGDVNDIFLFNEIISHLGLLELPFKGRSFTWSNMQDDPLLVQLDWVFTSNTMVTTLAKPTSDHVPYVVSIDTVIPKAKIFRFENYWVDQPGFLECVKKSWEQEVRVHSPAVILSVKFKRLRNALKNWKTSLSRLKGLITRCNWVLGFLDNLEEERPLFLPERNFRKLVKQQYEHLLKAQYKYWKNRCTIRWMKLGEENTKFFMLWPLRDIDIMQLLKFRLLMVTLSPNMMRLLLWPGTVIGKEWVLPMVLICS
jgi:hypothetical protein